MIQEEEYVLDESKLCIRLRPSTIGGILLDSSYGYVYIHTPDSKFSSSAVIEKNNRSFFSEKLSLTERCERAITNAKDDIRDQVKKHNEFVYLNNKYGTCKGKE